MANTFKNVHKRKVPASEVAAYTTAGGTTTIMLGMSICNVSDIDQTVDVRFNNTSGTTDVMKTYLVKDLDIPAESTIELFAGQKYVLETTDQIWIRASTADTLDVFIGIMEIT
tara:strand:- start:216 stop:554 length:339 start_codon:yes stop_codon:yes gene_type:complete